MAYSLLGAGSSRREIDCIYWLGKKPGVQFMRNKLYGPNWRSQRYIKFDRAQFVELIFMIIGVLLVLLPLCFSYEYQCGGTDWKYLQRIHINKKEVLTHTQHGYPLIVYASDQVVSSSILSLGSWDANLQTIIAAVVKPGDHVLNLGSQIGQEATMMSKIVGPTGSITVFEPYSASYRIVTKNLELNGARNYSKVYKYGAGEKEEMLTLYIDDFNTGGTSFVKDQNTKGAPEKVQVKTVDSVIGDKKIDFVLMDVENFELQAINGMRKLIKRSPALVILLEWKYLSNPNRNEVRTKELLDWLAGQGFTWYIYQSSSLCSLGSLRQMNIQQVLQVQAYDLFLAGPNANLSKFN